MALAAEQAGAVAIRIEGVGKSASHACGGERADYWNCETRFRILRYASRPILKMLMRWRRRARTLSPLTAPTARVRCLLKRCWHVFTITVYWR
ncbi:hypothetical protein ACVXHB_11680 [Escherichia coli]